MLLLGCSLACLPMLTCAQSADSDWLYTVELGDTLWDISARHLKAIDYWRRLQKLNQVPNPNRMPPGMQLRIPIEWLRQTPAQAIIVSTQGGVFALLAGNLPKQPVLANARLSSGDTVVTEADSNVMLRFGDGSRILLLGEGELILGSLRAFANTDMWDTRVRLERGRIETLARPAPGAASRFDVVTPAAVTAVRGTDYRVQAQAAESRVEVTGGKVAVNNDAGATELPAGFGTLAAKGSAPLPPIELLPAPRTEGLPKRLDAIPIMFELAPVSGATGYRLQITQDAEFRSLLFDGVSPSANLRGPDLPDGNYLMRVRALDDKRLEGHSAGHRFIIDARPLAPILVTPSPEAAVLQQRPLFEWGRDELVERYHFQLDDEPSFANPLMDERALREATVTAGVALSPGKYFWRVAGVDAQGKGPFSPVQTFRRPPDGIALQAAEVDEQRLIARWRAGEPGQKFQFQLAPDTAFTQLLLDTRTSEPQIEMPRPAPGRYAMRVKTIDVDGYEGPFGPAQTIDVAELKPPPPPPEKPKWWPFSIPALLFLFAL